MTLCRIPFTVHVRFIFLQNDTEAGEAGAWESDGCYTAKDHHQRSLTRFALKYDDRPFFKFIMTCFFFLLLLVS